ncbi:MAG: MoxR family ATPase, partial [Planctomycetaceae bacterium]|nr:MoxR family ATPase [Planctomycetaceae bacterium]
YPLPEAQRDRFLFNVIVDYPSREQEAAIIDRTTSTQSATLEAVVSGEEIIDCQHTVRLVPLPDHVRDFVLDLVRAARPKDLTTASWVRELIDWGPGPRACQQLVLAAKARALMQGRYHVTKDDVTALAFPVLRHRIVPTFSAEAEGISVDDIIRRLIKELPRKAGQPL